MKRLMRGVAVCALAAITTATGLGQQKPKMPKTPVQLELTAKVATTTDDGYPSSLRVTVKNVGGVTVDMPVPKEVCHPDGGVEVQIEWTPRSPEGKGWGHGRTCGADDMTPLSERMKNEWIRLRQGESLTITEPIERDVLHNGPGTATYWVEYTPPDASPDEVEKLMQAGTYIPTEKLETPHESFEVQ